LAFLTRERRRREMSIAKILFAFVTVLAVTAAVTNAVDLNFGTAMVAGIVACFTATITSVLR
jgi:hypothetical protein